MDGVHDLGGMEGFGPIPVKTGDLDFRDLQEWEKRMYALSRNPLAPGITLDWFRHCIERMVPADYLSYPYFAKWCTAYLVLMIDDGVVTLDEVRTGQAKETSKDAPPALSLDSVLAKIRASNVSFEVPADTRPAHSPGDIVTTRRTIPAPHTRLPRYARQATGEVIAYHGSHLFPDEGALGNKVGDHLYTVSFSAAELWGNDANPRDSVALEIWERYLVPPG